MCAACPPSWNHRGRGTGDAIYYDCLAPYISTTGHPGQKWNGVYGLALSRGVLARENPLHPSCRYFSMRWRGRSFDARSCAMKENEASEWGKVRNHIPRKTDGEEPVYVVYNFTWIKSIWITSKIDLTIDIIIVQKEIRKWNELFYSSRTR